MPSVRYETEQLCAELGTHCTLIRVNPDFPLAWKDGDANRWFNIVFDFLFSPKRP